MKGVCEFFTSLAEKDLDLEIEIGDDAKYKVVGLGTVAFQREFGKWLMAKDLLYDLGLTENLLYVLVMEGNGYVMTFMDEKAIPSS